MNDQFVSAPPDPSGSGFIVEEVKVRTGVWVNKGQTLFVLRPASVSPGKSAKSSLIRIKAEDSGKVKSVGVKRKQEIKAGTEMSSISNQKCLHPTVMKNMCADCGMDLQKDMPATGMGTMGGYHGPGSGMGGHGGHVRGTGQHAITNPDASASISVLHSIPELKVSSDEAVNLGREDERRLLQHRRLVLLVDLDQTLIHTTNEDIPPNLKNVHHFQLYGPQSPWYHTRIRPRTAQFLENVSKLYELHIVTFGARLYAHTIAKFLDKDSKYFSHRILSRDECFDNKSKTANLSSLFPCGDHMVCIIDDREDVWNYAPNLVHVKPYIFFKNTGDINAPQGSAKVPMPPPKDTKTAAAAAKTNTPAAPTIKKVAQVERSADKSEPPPPPAAAGSPPTSTERRDSIDMPTFDGLDQETAKAGDGKNAASKCENDDATSAVSDDLELSDEEDSNQSSKDAKAGDTKAATVEDKAKPGKEDSSGSSSSSESEKSGAEEDEKGKKKKKGEDGKEKGKKEEDGKEEGGCDGEVEGEAKVEDDLVDIEDTDDYLLYLEDALKAIHHTYYGQVDQENSKQVQPAATASVTQPANSKVPDLKQVIPSVKRKALRGSSIVFSGVVPNHVRLERSRPFLVARSLGAKVTEKVGDDTTHLVAARLGTAKVNQIRGSKKLESRIHLVTPNWLWDCAERWEKVDERLYSLCKSNVRVTVVDPPAHCSSPEDNAADRSPALPPELSGGSGGGGGMQRQISEESLNPFLAFSSEDLKGMDQEVEDILSNDSSSSSDDDEGDATKDGSSESEDEESAKPQLNDRIELPPVQSLSESSSSDDSMTGELPRGMKRKATSGDESVPAAIGGGVSRPAADATSDGNVDEEDDEPLEQFKRGARVDDSFGFDVANASDDEDDDEMAAQLEREFLGDSNSNF